MYEELYEADDDGIVLTERQVNEMGEVLSLLYGREESAKHYLSRQYDMSLDAAEQICETAYDAAESAEDAVKESMTDVLADEYLDVGPYMKTMRDVFRG